MIEIVTCTEPMTIYRLRVATYLKVWLLVFILTLLKFIIRSIIHVQYRHMSMKRAQQGRMRWRGFQTRPIARGSVPSQQLPMHCHPSGKFWIWPCYKVPYMYVYAVKEWTTCTFVYMYCVHLIAVGKRKTPYNSIRPLV